MNGDASGLSVAGRSALERPLNVSYDIRSKRQIGSKVLPSVDALSVSVVSDEPIFRDALVSLISSNPRFEAAPRRIVDLGAPTACHSCDPVALVDRPSLMPCYMEELRWLISENPSCRIVLLTAECSTEQMIEAFATGTSAIMHRAEATELLFGCLSLVQIKAPLLWGELALRLAFSEYSRSSADRIVDDYPMTSVMHNVTKREREIAECLAKCLTTEEIAGELHISPKTVRNHISNLYAKTGCHSRVELLTHLHRGQWGSVGGAVVPLRGERSQYDDDLRICTNSA